MLLSATCNRFAVGIVTTLAALLTVGTCTAQSNSGYESRSMGPIYRPAHAYPWAIGFGRYHASTAAEGFLNGNAAVIDSLGNYQLSESQAEIFREQARAMNGENNLKQTQGLLAQKKMWEDARIQSRRDSEARAAEGRRLLAEKRATIYRQAYQLPASELNLTTGEICWPAVLRDAKFQENRDRLDELFRQYVGYGSPNPETALEITRSIDQWARSLRNDVGSMPREDYFAAQKFLLGLKYGATSVVRAS